MSPIAGKWESVTVDKYDEYLKAAGVGMIQRNIAAKAKPTMEWIDLGGGKWQQKTYSTFKNFSVEYTIGQEFDEELMDGRKSKSIVLMEGDNTLVHKQNAGDFQSTVTRKFGPSEMVSTFQIGDVVATRTYKRV